MSQAEPGKWDLCDDGRWELCNTGGEFSARCDDVPPPGCYYNFEDWTGKTLVTDTIPTQGVNTMRWEGDYNGYGGGAGFDPNNCTIANGIPGPGTPVVLAAYMYPNSVGYNGTTKSLLNWSAYFNTPPNSPPPGSTNPNIEYGRASLFGILTFEIDQIAPGNYLTIWCGRVGNLSSRYLPHTAPAYASANATPGFSFWHQSSSDGNLLTVRSDFSYDTFGQRRFSAGYNGWFGRAVDTYGTAARVRIYVSQWEHQASGAWPQFPDLREPTGRPLSNPPLTMTVYNIYIQDFYDNPDSQDDWNWAGHVLVGNEQEPTKDSCPVLLECPLLDEFQKKNTYGWASNNATGTAQDIDYYVYPPNSGHYWQQVGFTPIGAARFQNVFWETSRDYGDLNCPPAQNVAWPGFNFLNLKMSITFNNKINYSYFANQKTDLFVLDNVGPTIRWGRDYTESPASPQEDIPTLIEFENMDPAINSNTIQCVNMQTGIESHFIYFWQKWVIRYYKPGVSAPWAQKQIDVKMLVPVSNVYEGQHTFPRTIPNVKSGQNSCPVITVDANGDAQLCQNFWLIVFDYFDSPRTYFGFTISDS